jgi:hypothetical protein
MFVIHKRCASNDACLEAAQRFIHHSLKAESITWQTMANDSINCNDKDAVCGPPRFWLPTTKSAIDMILSLHDGHYGQLLPLLAGAMAFPTGPWDHKLWSQRLSLLINGHSVPPLPSDNTTDCSDSSTSYLWYISLITSIIALAIGLFIGRRTRILSCCSCCGSLNTDYNSIK